MRAHGVSIVLCCAGCFAPVPQFEDGETVVTTDGGQVRADSGQAGDAGADGGSGGWGSRTCGNQICAGEQFCLSCPPGISDAGPGWFECIDAGVSPVAACSFPLSECLGLGWVDPDAGLIQCVNG